MTTMMTQEKGRTQKLSEKAIDYLSRREHSRAELKKKLITKAFLPEEIDCVIDNLVSKNFQSDIRFAESYVRYRKLSGFGPLKIIAELRERGVEDSIITTAVDIYSDEWQIQLIEVWKKKFSAGAKKRDKAAQFRFLASRGYLSEAINQLLFTS